MKERKKPHTMPFDAIVISHLKSYFYSSPVSLGIDPKIVWNLLKFFMKTMLHENSNATSKTISSHIENDEMYTFLRVKNLYDDYWSMPNIWPRILLIFFLTFSLWKNCYIPQSNWFSLNSDNIIIDPNIFNKIIKNDF